MSGKLTIGFRQVPRTLFANTGKYGILRPQAGLARVFPTTSKDPRGFWTAINPAWETFNDSGSFSYTGGTGQITGDYSAGGLPGGHNGTQKYAGVNLVINTTSPVLAVDSTHFTTGVSFRYFWNAIEPTTAGNYTWDRLDADLAQCIARGCMWLPIIIVKTFDTAPGNPAPTYLNSITSATGGGAYCMWRWNATTFKNNFANLVAAIGARYDVVANFAGIATQETAVPAISPSATGYSSPLYLSTLQAESDAVSAACPTSWHWAYQNFMLNYQAPPLSSFGINWADYLMDQYAAYIQQNDAILMGPDLVTGGSVVTRCYPRQLPYHNTAGGTVTRNAQAGWPGGSTTFSGGGGTGLALQNAEWNSSPPAQTNTPVQTAYNYGVSGVTTRIDVCMEDWHQNAGSPGNQKFNPDGANLVKNNAYPFNTIWVP